MAESPEIDNKIVTQKENPKEPRNLFSLFSKFKLKFPFFDQEKTQEQPRARSAVEEKMSVAGGEESDFAEQKPNFVTFPKTSSIFPAPLGVEVEESSGRTHNPIVIWQVYAVGGFIVLKWVWARWKERQERSRKATGDDNQSSDEENANLPPDYYGYDNANE